MLRVLLPLFALTLLLPASELTSERLWTGANGKSFRGIFVRTLEAEGQVEIAAPGNKIYKIALDNLSAADRSLVEAEITRQRRAAEDRERREQPRTSAHPEREWTEKGLKGAYLGPTRQGDGIEIRVAGGATKVIRTRELGEADLAWLRSLDSEKLARADEERRNGTGAFAGLRPDPEFDRSTIPLLDEETIGVSMRWGTRSVCSFILWWDQMGWIEVPRGRDLADKAEWLNKRLGRHTDGNTSVASVEEVMEGYASYFDSRFENEATFNFYLEYDLNPARLAQLASGPNACILRGSVATYGPYFALLEASPDGSVRLGIEGKSIDATLEPAGEDSYYGSRREVPLPGGEKYDFHQVHGTPSRDLTRYRLVVRDRSLLPEEFRDPEHEITISPRTPLIVFRPYLFIKPGEKVGPPRDPLFGLDRAH